MLILLGSNRKDCSSWKAMRSAIGKTGKESLRRKIMTFDIANVTQEMADRAHLLMAKVELDRAVEVRDVGAVAGMVGRNDTELFSCCWTMMWEYCGLLTFFVCIVILRVRWARRPRSFTPSVVARCRWWREAKKNWKYKSKKQKLELNCECGGGLVVLGCFCFSLVFFWEWCF